MCGFDGGNCSRRSDVSGFVFVGQEKGSTWFDKRVTMTERVCVLYTGVHHELHTRRGKQAKRCSHSHRLKQNRPSRKKCRIVCLWGLMILGTPQLPERFCATQVLIVQPMTVMCHDQQKVRAFCRMLRPTAVVFCFKFCFELLLLLTENECAPDTKN